MPGDSRSGPLAGLRVLELADEKGHYCGRLLADMGADVVKVEPPGGDAARRVGPFVDDIIDRDRSLFFWHYNANKRGITLDLQLPQGQVLLKQLAARADILLETHPPGTMDAWGLDYSGLRTQDPGLIYASLTPFGQSGPYRDFVTSDLVSLALGGPMASCGYDDIEGAPPIRGEYHQAYHIGSHYAFLGILVALFSRGVTGRGQYIDVSIHEACSCTTEGAFPAWVYHQKVVKRQTARHATIRPTLPFHYACKDGKYLHIVGGLPRDSRSWGLLLDWMGSSGMAGDLGDQHLEFHRLRSLEAADARAVHIREVLSRFFAGLPSEEAYHGCQQRGIAAGIIRSPEENLQDPHFAEDRGFFVEIPDTGLEKPAWCPGAPYRFEKTPWTLRRGAPGVGEHNHEIFCGDLGLSQAELTALAEAGVV